jgi:hypothetical protein
MRRGSLIWLALLALPLVVGALHGAVDRRFSTPLEHRPWPPQGPLDLRGQAPAGPLDLRGQAPAGPLDLRGQAPAGPLDLRGQAPAGPLDLRGQAPAGPQEPATVAPRLRIPDRPPPLSYEIQARLEPRSRRITGTLRVRFVNRARVPLSELRLHLYLSAFAHGKTLFAKTSGGSHRGRRARTPGWIRVAAPRLATDHDQGATKLSAQRLHDGTVLALKLPPGQQLAPGAKARLALRFEAQLPRIYARTGYAGDLHMIAQWYPKLGVLRTDGSWHCPPFHANSEFFADFARYRLRFTLPARYVVGHSGARLKRRVLAGGREQELSIAARWVHDVALCAWPHFVERRRVVDGVDVRLLTVPGRGKSTRQLDLIAFGLRRIGRWFGAYPYRQLTVVDLPAMARGADAMEYPQLFTVWYPYGAPPAIRAVDEVLLHELTHQYFQGLVASNEVREPWLDEGLTTFVSGLLADARFGRERSFVDLGPLRVGQRDKNQLHQASGADDVAIARPAAKFASWRRYGAAVYGRTAALLYTASSVIGRRRLLAGLSDYVQRHAFAHPTRVELVAALERAASDATRPALRRLLKTVLDGERPFEVSLACEPDTLVIERGTLRLPLTIRWRSAASGRPPRTRRTVVPARGPAVTRLSAPGLIDAELGPPDRLPLSVAPLTRRCSLRAGSWGAAARLSVLVQGLLTTVAP